MPSRFVLTSFFVGDMPWFILLLTMPKIDIMGISLGLLGMSLNGMISYVLEKGGTKGIQPSELIGMPIAIFVVWVLNPSVPSTFQISYFLFVVFALVSFPLIRVVIMMIFFTKEFNLLKRGLTRL